MDNSKGSTGNQLVPEHGESIQKRKRDDSLYRFSDIHHLPVMVTTDVVTQSDLKTIQPKYYNQFNFSKLASSFGEDRMAIGVTSANRGDGKTLVASNLAVSLATGYRQETLLVDMNFDHPGLHSIFGTPRSPGMAEAIASEEIHVTPTEFDRLSILTAGSSEEFPPGIEHTLLLRQILQTLKHRFDFIIIDMPSILPVKNFPIHFINEFDGLISVIDTTRTKRRTFGKIFDHIDESRFIGYVFNREEES